MTITLRKVICVPAAKAAGFIFTAKTVAAIYAHHAIAARKVISNATSVEPYMKKATMMKLNTKEC